MHTLCYILSIALTAAASLASLETVSMGNGIKSIEQSVFEYCSSLATINYAGTISEWQAIEISSTWAEYTGDYTISCDDGTISK